MVRVIKALILLLVIVVAGIFLWGYAPDRDPDELKRVYGAPPSIFLPLPNGQKVHVRDEGPRQAPVILLLHGSNASLHTWQGWVEGLGRDFRIVRYDQPGHGLTGPQVDGDYTAKAYSDTAAMVMEQLGIEKYIVAGNSMGGWVAWNHALAYPDRVTGLILVDSSGAPDAKPTSLPIGFRLAQQEWLRPVLSVFTPRLVIERSLAQTVADPRKLTEEQIDRYWNLLRYPGNRKATAERSTVPRDNATTAEMAKIAVPTLILWGGKDTLIPASAATWFDKAIPQSNLIVYPDLGHIPMEEDPERTAGDVLQWARDLGLDEKPAADEASPAEPPAVPERNVPQEAEPR